MSEGGLGWEFYAGLALGGIVGVLATSAADQSNQMADKFDRAYDAAEARRRAEQQAAEARRRAEQQAAEERRKVQQRQDLMRTMQSSDEGRRMLSTLRAAGWNT